jgi:uncharacterized protein YjbI with pentapeptide repeats
MANPEHIEIVRQGAEAIVKWREAHPGDGMDLRGVDLRNADLREVDLGDADLSQANLHLANFQDANLNKANLTRANLCRAQLLLSTFSEADLSEADLLAANLWGANFSGATLRAANLSETCLLDACLSKANLRGANLEGADLTGANLNAANLSNTRMQSAVLVKTELGGANLSGARVYGASVWDLKLDDKTIQSNLVITPTGSAEVTVDNLEVAQFVYLVLNNPKIREVINTIGRKGVLILGRFTERKHVLEAIRAEVRKHDLVPIVFDFERPVQRDFSETVLTLAGMSRFIIADTTDPKSVPLEAQLVVPSYMIPFVPLVEKGQRTFAMFQDLWKKHGDWVLKPLEYDSVEQLIRVFESAILKPANERRDQLMVRKDEELVVRKAEDYEDKD